MKIDWRVWIPLLGLCYGLKDGFVLFMEDWLRYQLMCYLLFVLILFGIYN